MSKAVTPEWFSRAQEMMETLADEEWEYNEVAAMGIFIAFCSLLADNPNDKCIPKVLKLMKYMPLMTEDATLLN